MLVPNPGNMALVLEESGPGEREKEAPGMRCLACGVEVAGPQLWDHLRAVHLTPREITRESILVQAQLSAQPLEIRSAPVTCLKLPEKILYFSLENAELLIAFAAEQSPIPWRDIVTWQVLHEKGHLTLLGRYEPPPGVRFAVLVNAEDYYINRFLIPEQYWPVCLLNARCAVTIRTLAPVPGKLRDFYFYLTMATFLAYEAVTLAEAPFLDSREADLVAALAPLFREITAVPGYPGPWRRPGAPSSIPRDLGIEAAWK